MSASALLAELGTVFGREFIESVVAKVNPEGLDEAMVPMSKSQAKREKARPAAMKKAMAAIERGFGRYEKKRGVAAIRKMKADVAKEVAKHDKEPGDAVKKALSGLRAMKSKKSDKKADKGGAKKAPETKPGKRKEKFQAVGGGAKGSGKAGGGGAGGAERGKQKGAAGSGAKGQHYPFKNSPNLGKGPGTPPGFPKVQGARHHNQKKCWNCDCGPVYTAGCICKSTGADPEKCPEGRTKHVKIRKDYRDAYNKMYHAWRAKKGGAVTARLKGGGRPGGF